MSREKPIKVIPESKDGVQFEIDRSVATPSETIKNLMEQVHGTNTVQLDLTGLVLSRVVQYWSLKAKSDATQAKVSMKLKSWSAKFEEDVEEVMVAVNCRELVGVMRKITHNITPEEDAAFF